MGAKALGSLLILTALVVSATGQQIADEWNDKGIALGYQGKYDDAIAAFDKAIEIDPKHANAWIIKGRPHRVCNQCHPLGSFAACIPPSLPFCFMPPSSP